MLENILRYHHSTSVSIHVYMRLTHILLDLRDEYRLPTVCIKIRDQYPKSNFLLKRYTYTDTPLSEVPNLLTRIDSGSPDSFDMIKFKLSPSALVDAPEPHRFILHYCCKDDEKLGFYLVIRMAALKRPDNLSLVGGFDLKIEMHYIDENSGHIMSNNSVDYNSRIFVEHNEYYYVRGYLNEHNHVPRSEFTMDVKHELVSDTSPDSMVDLNIVS
jgi:hypothetical protein